MGQSRRDRRGGGGGGRSGRWGGSADPGWDVAPAQPQVAAPEIAPAPETEVAPAAPAPAVSDTPLLDAAADAGGTYRVRRGDTLADIAARYGVSEAALASANGLSAGDRVRRGTVLQIPAAAAATPAPAANRAPVTEPPAPAADTPAPAADTPAPVVDAPAPGTDTAVDANAAGTTTDANATANAAPSTGYASYPSFGASVQAALGRVAQDQQAYASTAIPNILTSCARQGVRNANQVAYILATAEHESRFGKPLYSRSESLVEDHNPYRTAADGTMSATVHTNGRSVTGANAQELDEHYWDSAYGGRLGNVAGTSDGANYKGRGYVQLTGRTNYADMTRRLTASNFTYTIDGVTYGGPGNPIDLEAHPDHVNRSSELAAQILVLGSTEGSFTGRALGDYVNDTDTNFYDARAVINGDKAKNGQSIADIATAYSAAISASWNSFWAEMAARPAQL